MRDSTALAPVPLYQPGVATLPGAERAGRTAGLLSQEEANVAAGSVRCSSPSKQRVL